MSAKRTLCKLTPAARILFDQGLSYLSPGSLEKVVIIMVQVGENSSWRGETQGAETLL